MTDCLFCKIIKGEIQSFKIWEDEDVIAFLDINPFTPGHTIVASKKHYKNIFDVPQKELVKIILLAQKVSKFLRKNLGVKGINFLHNSNKAGEQFIFHFHLHVIPRYSDDNLHLWPTKHCKVNLKEIQQKLMEDF